MGVGFNPQGVLGGWAPGQLAHKLPDGYGWRLPKGADVVMQVHYHRTGRVEKDRTSIGLYFAKKPGTQPFKGLIIPGLFLVIPRRRRALQGPRRDRGDAGLRHSTTSCRTCTCSAGKSR